jgi:nitroreductase
MELQKAVRSRRMVRSFSADPIEPAVLESLLDLARRAPSAGHTQAVELVVLEGAAETARYWDATLPEPRRASFRWQGLLRAPVLVVVVTRPRAYVERYAEPDKTATGLGAGEDAWAMPYWFVDAGMVVQNLLVAAVAAGLGGCLFGPFDHEPAVLGALGVPDGWRAVATVALGHPDGLDEPGRSTARGWRPLEEIVHRATW